MRLYTSELVKKYKARTVVDHVSIDVNQGEIVGLLGPNGAGKTTTFYMIVGLIKPNEGRIFLESDEGQASELTDLPVYRRAQLGVGYLAQEASVFRRLSVEDNIRAVLEMTSFSKEYQNERVEALIEEFRLQKVRKSLGIQLSGGERRRTEIARAVAINPAFILLDEPFAGVDPIAVEDIQSIVATLKHKNIGVIITDHNVDETLAITDRTYLLYEGKILKTGTAEELAADAFGAAHAFFMVGGTTSSVQAMVLSNVKKGDEIILPRNVHQSVINALVLCGATPVYINPQSDKNLGIALGMSLSDVRATMERHPNAKAILINNPTYYGICSDLKSITEAAHQKGMRVLVAHAGKVRSRDGV